jgi:signal transduction histidine kinase
MTIPKDISRLSKDEKWERIRQLEAELGNLYQSLSKSEQALVPIPSPEYKQQPDILKYQEPTLEDVSDVTISYAQILLHAIPDMVMVFNYDLDFLLVNQALASWFNIHPDKIRGQNIVTLLPGFEKSMFYREYKEAIKDGQSRIVVDKYDADEVNADDQQWYESRVFPIEDGILVISRDITRQRETDAQMLEYELAGARMQMLDKVVHNLAHDLRTPLSVLHTSLYLLEHYTDPEKQQQKLTTIKRQVTILEKMIENILLLTELDFYSPSDLVSVDMTHIVDDAVQALKSQVDTKHQLLTLKLPNQAISHLVNPDHLIRAIRNIIENAIYYTPEGGAIDIILQTQPSDGFQIIVTDIGTGIDDDDLPHIFERFYRANPARTINEAGNGLGLSIAQEIVELHYGTIAVVSQLGKGTQVTITI